MIKLLSLTIFVLSVCIAVQAQQNVCADVLTYAGRNIVARSDERARRSYVYQQVCRGKYRESSGSIKAGLDFVIESVPVGFDFGATNRRQRVETFCSQNTDVSNESAISSSFDSFVYGPSVDAWNSCIRANTQDFRIEPTLHDDSAPIFKVINQKLGTGKVEIRDVSVSNDSTTCSVLTNGKEEVFEFGTPPKVIELASGQLANIKCRRKSTKRAIDGSEKEITPEVSISILTSVNDFQIKLPTKEAVLVSETRMNDILARLSAVEDKLFVGNGCIRLNKTQICWGKAVVTDNPGGSHTKLFEARFEKPFAEGPIVTHGVNTHGSGHAVAVYRWVVTPNGFSGALNNMHSHSAIGGVVTMDYTAIGKSVD